MLCVMCIRICICIRCVPWHADRLSLWIAIPPILIRMVSGIMVFAPCIPSWVRTGYILTTWAVSMGGSGSADPPPPGSLGDRWWGM